MLAKQMAPQEQQAAKEAVAKAVVDRIELLWTSDFRPSGREMSLGLGTGSTVEPAIHVLGKLLQEGRIKNIAGMPTSDRTGELAIKYGIRLIEPKPNVRLDYGFDGADFIDNDLLHNKKIAYAIKGGGAAHVVEREVAERCDQWVIIADQSKVVRSLNHEHWIPVEVPRENLVALKEKLTSMGAVKIAVREEVPEIKRKAQADNGNPVLEVHFRVVDADLVGKLDALESTLGAKHGLFYGMADQVIIAGPDGRIQSIDCTRMNKR